MEKQTAVLWLIEKWSTQGTLYSSDIFQAKQMEIQQAHEYAEFAIRCDRKEMKILNFDGFINLE